MASSIPTKNKVANSLVSSVMGNYGFFAVHTGGPAHDDEVEFEGRTPDGTLFAFTLKVLDVEEIA